MTTSILSVTVDDATRERLTRLAEATGRSEAEIAAEAIADTLEADDRYVAAVKEGLASADRGELIPHEEVVRWVESLGTDHELPMPVPRGR